MRKKFVLTNLINNLKQQLFEIGFNLADVSKLIAQVDRELSIFSSKLHPIGNENEKEDSVFCNSIKFLPIMKNKKRIDIIFIGSFKFNKISKKTEKDLKESHIRDVYGIRIKTEHSIEKSIYLSLTPSGSYSEYYGGSPSFNQEKKQWNGFMEKKCFKKVNKSKDYLPTLLKANQTIDSCLKSLKTDSTNYRSVNLVPNLCFDSTIKELMKLKVKEQIYKNI